MKGFAGCVSVVHHKDLEKRSKLNEADQPFTFCPIPYTFNCRLDINDLPFYCFEVFVLHSFPGYKINPLLKLSLYKFGQVDKFYSHRLLEVYYDIDVAVRRKILPYYRSEQADGMDMKLPGKFRLQLLQQVFYIG